VKTFFIAFLSFVMVTFVSSASSGESLTAPKLTNNPSLDVIATNERPLLSIFNASGGTGKRTYIFQIDTVPDFDSESFIEYKDIPETNEYITEKQIEKKDALSPSGKTTYYWRARAVDEAANKGPWGQTRFFLDTASDDTFMNLLRIPVEEVTVSSGQNPKNILTCMAYGYTFARTMGFSDITSLALDEHKEVTKITIIKDLPIFQGIPNPFTAPEVHSWAVSPVSLPEDYEITSESTYIQTIKSKTKFLYGEQFHAEIKTDYNEAMPYLVNFLKMGLRRKAGNQ